MLKGLRRLASDTLTRRRIDSAVARFSQGCRNGSTVYDLGGVERYGYRRHFSGYRTVNIDPRENPDVLADAAALPFGDCSVDGILCLALLEHVDDPDPVLEEMHRVMKPGARALVWVPFYWREHNYPIDSRRYTEQGVCALLKRRGFSIVESSSRPYSGLFFVLSHNARFLMRDPHSVRAYDPLLYAHAALCGLSRLDSVFKLEHPYVYTGVEAVIER